MGTRKIGGSELRRIMKWWRARHPRLPVRVIASPWFGRILWNPRAGMVARLYQAVEEYRANAKG